MTKQINYDLDEQANAEELADFAANYEQMIALAAELGFRVEESDDSTGLNLVHDDSGDFSLHPVNWAFEINVAHAAQFLRERKAKQLRADADRSRKNRQDSIDRNGGDIDTNNCVTTFCGDLSAQESSRKAELLDAGGKAEFDGLFDRETGERVRAKYVYRPNEPWNGCYGSFWMFCDENDKPTGRFLSDSKGSPRSKMYREGFEKRREQAWAGVKIMGSGTGLSGLATCHVGIYRADEGYPSTAVVR